MERDWMIFFRSFYEAGRFLSDDERLDYYDRILNYWIEWVDKKKGEKVEMLFWLIRPNIDSNNKKYEDWIKWWAPKWNTNAKKDYKTKQPPLNWKNNHSWKTKTSNVDVEEDVEEDKDKDKKNIVLLTLWIEWEEETITHYLANTLAKLWRVPAKSETVDKFKQWALDLINTYKYDSSEMGILKTVIDEFRIYRETQVGEWKKVGNRKTTFANNRKLKHKWERE